MAIHDLATNALKYGALSRPQGQVAVVWHLVGGPRGVLLLRWAETDGPPMDGPSKQRGFGSRVLSGTVHGQLVGEMVLDWAHTGPVCEMMVPLVRIQGDPLALSRNHATTG